MELYTKYLILSIYEKNLIGELYITVIEIFGELVIVVRLPILGVAQFVPLECREQSSLQ